MVDYVWRDGSRLTPWMLYQINRLDADFYKLFGVRILVTSGIRTEQEQIAIFLARYVTAANIRGRKVYDTRVWNGVRYYRISSLGTVAQPKTSNHEIQGTKAAVDLRDSGTTPGVASGGNARANWLKANAYEYDLVPSGYGFGEPWHYDVLNIFKAPPGSLSGGGGSVPLPTPSTEEETIMGVADDITATILSGVRREQRFRQFSSIDGKLNALGLPGRVIRLSNNFAEAQEQKAQISATNALLFPPDEFKGTLPRLDPTAFYTLVDAFDPDGDHGFGQFVKNVLEIKEGVLDSKGKSGSTKMIRISPAEEVIYSTRHLVWANGRTVELLYGGVKIQTLKKPNQAVLVDGRTVILTAVEVARANSQRPAGQTWN